MVYSNLWSGATDTSRSTAPTTDGHWALAFYLSPRDAGTKGDRIVVGNRARLLSANLQYLFANKGELDVNIRMTVLECKSYTNPTGGGTFNWTSNAILDRLFKNEEPAAGNQDFLSFLSANGSQRDYYSMNTGEFKILRQNIITLGPHNASAVDHDNKPSVQGIHMYVKMNRLMDHDDRLTSVENVLRSTYGAASTTNYTRMAYYKPILVLVEIIPQIGRTYTGQTMMVDMERMVKYTFTDGE